MVTTRNSAYGDTAIFDGDWNLPLDEFIFVLKNSEHTPSIHGDILKYVHEKPRCHDICKNGTGVKRARYKKTLEAGLMVNSEIYQGGKLFVC
jgi:hypothetical protein